MAILSNEIYGSEVTKRYLEWSGSWSKRYHGWSWVWHRSHKLANDSVRWYAICSYPISMREAVVAVTNGDEILAIVTPTSSKVRSASTAKSARSLMLDKERNTCYKIYNSEGKEIDCPKDLDLAKVCFFASHAYDYSMVAKLIREYSNTPKSRNGGRNLGQFGRDCGIGFDCLPGEFFREYSDGATIPVRVILAKNDRVVVEAIIEDENSAAIGFSSSLIMSADAFFECLDGKVLILKKGSYIPVPHRKDGSMGRRVLEVLGVEE